jgi:hypothetical protein
VTICTPWRVANSLNQLLTQANTEAPGRAKGADGSIGDPAHQTKLCASQHNSCCVKFNGVWIIRARDFTHDPAGGFDSYAFAEQLRLSRDPRIRYIISNGRITGPSYGWTWHPYSGSDPHKNHAHVSVVDTQALFDDTSRAWRIKLPVAAKPPQAVSAGALLEEHMQIATVLKPPAGAKSINGKTLADHSRGYITPAGWWGLDDANYGKFHGDTDYWNHSPEFTWDEILGLSAALRQPPATLDPAQVKAAVQEALDAVNADPGNEVSLSAAGLASVADAVTTRIGQKLGTVQP